MEASPLRFLDEQIRRAQFEIALERAAELDQLIKVNAIKLFLIESNEFNCSADVGNKIVKISSGTNERMWANIYAAVYGYLQYQKNDFTTPISLQSSVGGGVHAIQLIEWARRRNLGDEANIWPDDLPRPDDESSGEGVAHANVIFVKTIGFFILHEIAHIVLGHMEMVDSKIMHREEFEADEWAYDWVMTKWAEYSPKIENFEIRSMSIAISLALHAGLEMDGRLAGCVSVTHPNTIDRLLKFLNKYCMPEDRDGVKLAWGLACCSAQLHFSNTQFYIRPTTPQTLREILTGYRIALE